MHLLLSFLILLLSAFPLQTALDLPSEPPASGVQLINEVLAGNLPQDNQAAVFTTPHASHRSQDHFPEAAELIEEEKEDERSSTEKTTSQQKHFLTLFNVTLIQEIERFFIQDLSADRQLSLFSSFESLYHTFCVYRL